MSKITLEEIEQTLTEVGWSVKTDKYINLDTEMHFICAENHDIYTTWGKLRKKIECPICKKKAAVLSNEKIVPKAKNVTRTIALDQASHITGYAIFDNTMLVTSGTFETNKTEEVERISTIKQWLISIINSWKPDIIGLEGIQLQDESNGKKMGVTVFETLARLQGVLQNVCYEYNIPCEICPTNTWRHICGVKGKTRTDKKKSMQLLVKQWYCINVSDDIADAIGIGHYLCNKVQNFTTVENWEE